MRKRSRLAAAGVTVLGAAALVGFGSTNLWAQLPDRLPPPAPVAHLGAPVLSIPSASPSLVFPDGGFPARPAAGPGASVIPASQQDTVQLGPEAQEDKDAPGAALYRPVTAPTGPSALYTLPP